MKILVVENDATLALRLRKHLLANGHQVILVSTGQEGLALARVENCDLLIIESMLESLDGISLVKFLRGSGHTTPILVLLKLEEPNQHVQALQAGASDYLAKPFTMREFNAHVEAIRLNKAAQAHRVFKVRDIEIDTFKREVRRDGRTIDLMPQEFKLLEFILRNDGKAVTKSMLLQHVWGINFDPQTTLVETNMSRLRAKLDRDFPNPLIVTKRGVGYQLAS